ncbi:MAG: DUF2115 domain-containing protein [Methanomicrobiaceae archaeon]|nr:DUF2115 domain-containing protein [Methanomicrobiaceae archaeon]
MPAGENAIRIAHPEEYAYIEELAGRLAGALSKGELAAVLAAEVEDFSLFELAVIGGRMRAEVDRLPMPYREKVRPFFERQVFGMHHRLLSLHRKEAFAGMHEPISDRETFEAFCAMLPAGCFCWEEGREDYPHLTGPRNTLFYYLLAAFSMFVAEEPGHPVGTPFPGGFVVEAKAGEYRCPIRDREEEVPYSICNFCPARQTEMP